MDPKGSMYKKNRIGPRIEPWGTPHKRNAEDTKSPRRTGKLLSDRSKPMQYLHNANTMLHSRNQNVMVYSVKCSCKIWNMRTAASQWLVTGLCRDVSVPWRDLKPDWNTSWKPCSSKKKKKKKDCICINSTFSYILERNGSFEIRKKLLSETFLLTSFKKSYQPQTFKQ